MHPTRRLLLRELILSLNSQQTVAQTTETSSEDAPVFSAVESVEKVEATEPVEADVDVDNTAEKVEEPQSAPAENLPETTEALEEKVETVVEEPEVVVEKTEAPTKKKKKQF